MQRIRKRTENSLGGVNLSPMIDMVFILLIFFVVTAVFVDEDGFAASTPDGTEFPDREDQPSLSIYIDKQNRVFVGEELATPSSIRPKVAQRLGINSKLSVSVSAAPVVDAGLMIEVMDQVRLGGVDLVSLSLDAR